MSVRTRRGFLGLLAAGALALLAGRWLAGQYADWRFFDALGFGTIWTQRARYGSALTGGVFAAVAGFAFLNLFAVRQSIVSLVLPRQLGGLEIAEAVPTRRLTLIAAVIAVLVGALFAVLPHDWTAAALAWDSVPFREVDPYLERDLGFYVAWLPWERALHARTTAVVVTVGLIVVLAYAATPSIRWGDGGLYVSTWARRHLTMLVGLVVVLVGWNWRLDRYERLIQEGGIWLDTATGSLFSAYDHRIALPYLGVAAFASIPIAAVLMWAGWRGYLRIAFAMLTALVIAGPVAGAVLPLVARGPLSTPEAGLRERPYLNTSALYTRRAFGVDEIAAADTVELATVPMTMLPRAVSAWDPAALHAAHGDASARSDAGLAWRATPDGLEAIVLRRPRDDGPAQRAWNTRAFAAARSDEGGRPFLAPSIRDAGLPGVLVHPRAGTFALVADSLGRIAAPTFASTFERMALAWDLQDPRLLFREAPAPRPRLVTKRDVRERISHLLPFLQTGSLVTPIVRGDSLYWFVDLFVTSRVYPLADAITVAGRTVRYARPAAQAVVQAQTGQVIVIPVERPDPVMERWMRRFPDVFTPMAAAPEWIARERPPAVDWLLAQGSALARVGFQGDTLRGRRVARPDDADAEVVEGGPTFFQLDSTGTIGWGLPVDAPAMGRTLGILVARGGVTRRTEYHSTPGPRWTTTLEQLQGAADAAGFGRSLPNARRGRVQAIPTVLGAVWVQSFYEWAPDGAPRLAGVVVSTAEHARAGRTLGEALGAREPLPTLGADAFRERVARLYDAMQDALRTGDWRMYGEAWAALGRLVERR